MLFSNLLAHYILASELPPRRRIYCDLDGVLVDFERGVKNLDRTLWSIKDINPEAFWNAIAGQGAQFWSELPWLPGARRLWAAIKPYTPFILSAYPKERKYAMVGKKQWVEFNLGPEMLDRLILCRTPDKLRYAAPGAMLIDDMEGTIERWNECGGIGLLHRKLDDTIRALKSSLGEITANTNSSIYTISAGQKKLINRKLKTGPNLQFPNFMELADDLLHNRPRRISNLDPLVLMLRISLTAFTSLRRFGKVSILEGNSANQCYYQAARYIQGVPDRYFVRIIGTKDHVVHGFVIDSTKDHIVYDWYEQWPTGYTSLTHAWDMSVDELKQLGMFLVEQTPMSA